MNIIPPLTQDLVVLDMAGTTVQDDDAVNRCLCAALACAGLVVTRDEVNEVMGMPKPVAIGLLLERGGTFQTRPERTLIVNSQQRKILEEANLVETNGSGHGAGKEDGQKVPG